jgi:hypothetical protein
MRCAACANDVSHKLPSGGDACARMRTTARQWWEREPGWFRDSIRDPAPLTYAPPPYGTPVSRMNEKQLAAELGRQSKRLGAALVGDFAGPRAAEEYTLARRAELGLDVTLDLLEAVA